MQGFYIDGHQDEVHKGDGIGRAILSHCKLLQGAYGTLS